MSFRTFVAAALAASVMALSLPADAEASHRKHRHRTAAAAAIGFGIGALFGSAIAQPRYRSYGYYDRPVRYRHYGLQPWTPEWHHYCDRKYRSFNHRTGYFLGYDGRYHFCR